jgi:mannose-1-phosphate guanylyltransferase
MRVVLLSGGSGKRLWPLSNEIRSKAFLKLLRKEEGGSESMIQRVCRQLEQAGLLASTCIVTHHSQMEITRNHIGDRIPVISEPFKKGTFTAIALAAAYMHSRQGAAPDEVVCVMPVDAFVLPVFYGLIHHFPAVLAHSGADLALIGTEPGSPSSQFGYMVPRDRKETGFYDIAQFVEKPHEMRAIELINQGALWNCGVFAFRLDYLLGEMSARGLPLDDRELLEEYEHLEERSFDEEVVEKAAHTVAIPYQGPWEDLGGWAAFAEHLEHRVTGLGQVDEDSVNSHLVNELNCPIHVIDVPDIIVAASPDGILVASKEKSSRIKDRLKSSARPPLYEEKRWGSRYVLDYNEQTGQQEQMAGGALTSKLTVLPGRSLSYHVHKERREILVVQAGEGECILDGVVFPVKAGDSITVPCGVKHGIRAVTELTCIEVHLGRALLYKDTERLALLWEEALRYDKGP